MALYKSINRCYAPCNATRKTERNRLEAYSEGSMNFRIEFVPSSGLLNHKGREVETLAINVPNQASQEAAEAYAQDLRDSYARNLRVEPNQISVDVSEVVD